MTTRNDDRSGEISICPCRMVSAIEDPVRMYLKEIGKVPLLTCRRSEKIELAKTEMEALVDRGGKETSGRGKPASGCKHCKTLCGTWYAVSWI